MASIRYFEDQENKKRRLPDLTLVKDNQKIGFEIKYIRDARFMLQRLRDYVYRGFYEISQGRCDILYITVVVDHDKNSELQRWIKRFEIPKGVKILILEAFTNDEGNVVDLHFVKELPDK